MLAFMSWSHTKTDAKTYTSWKKSHILFLFLSVLEFETWSLMIFTQFIGH